MLITGMVKKTDGGIKRKSCMKHKRKDKKLNLKKKKKDIIGKDSVIMSKECAGSNLEASTFSKQKIHLPKDPQEFSANWKKLFKEVIIVYFFYIKISRLF